MKSFAAACLGLVLLLPVAAAADPGPITPLHQQALSHARAGRFDQAGEAALQTKDPLLSKIVRWMALTRPDSNAGFAEIVAFIQENPIWPAVPTLQRRAEEAITPTVPDLQLLAWFAAYPPLTVDGRMAQVRALINTGDVGKAAGLARETWVSGNFGPLQERQFLTLFGAMLRTEDHAARLDRLLWDRQEAAAQRMLLKVEMGRRLLAQARIVLMNGAAGAEAALAKVPAELRNDPGLIYERLRWRRRKELDAEAIALLDHPARNKVRPDLWWTERAILARGALRGGNAAEAYRLAADHGLSEGVSLAEAEFLAGWVALRFLGDRDKAARHFKKLYHGVTTPVSLARGAYWSGRAATDPAAAQRWYELAAQHVTTFYGQLAAARLGRDFAWPRTADPRPDAADAAAFERHELTRAARLLAQCGELEALQAFLLRITDIARSPAQRVLAADFAMAHDRPEMAVLIGRRSEREGVPLLSAGYPLLPVEATDSPEQALVLALIRQESGFRREAISRAGALGLMQLIPDTAKRMAKVLSVGYSPELLTSDPGYNIRLGTAYLKNMLGNFDGSYVLSLAAYNAGPGRARRWLGEMGDPRDPAVDAVDWIESIPFGETRNYVQRVLESVQVYRYRLGLDHPPAALERDVKG